MEAIAAEDARVALEGVHLAFGERKVFQDLHCAFAPGTINVILGGSGAGKSTLLRVVGGLQQPDRGSVQVAGEEVTRLSERDLYRVRQNIGMLFQGGALLDSLDVFENLALPLREHGERDADAIAREVRGRLEAVGLPGVEKLMPRQLSGGMVRRVALARAIIGRPKIVICDEPFSGLDPLNVRRIEALLVRLNRRYGLTLLVASHHITSALRMADQLLFLIEGHAIAGTPSELGASRNPRVVQFLSAEDAAEAEVAAWDRES